MMTTGKENRPDQKATIERLLDDEQVLVHVNPHASGLVLPEHLIENRTVTLRLSRYFKGELYTDEEKVTAELLFGAEYFTCVLPWASIWGASSIRGEEFVWTDSAPAEILDLVLSQQQSHQTPMRSTPPAAEIFGAKLRKTRTNPGHLRRVK